MPDDAADEATFVISLRLRPPKFPRGCVPAGRRGMLAAMKGPTATRRATKNRAGERPGLGLLAWALASACSPDPAPMEAEPTTDGSTTTPAADTTAAGTTGDASSGDASSGDSSSGEPPSEPDYGQPGPHPVGHARLAIDDASGMRSLPVQLWYPADPAEAPAADAGVPLEQFEPRGPERELLAGLVADAPAGCTRAQTRSAADAVPAEADPWPLVVFSHCHECVRFSSFSIAERLASHGFAVAAVDHVGNTLYDAQAGTGVELSSEFLAVRVTDVARVLDVLLDAAAPELPPALAGRFDAARVGAMGHSFGAVTTGRVLQDDDRVRAGLVIAAPVQNPLLPGVSLAEIDEPMLMMLAQEDNSILELGNDLLRSNFADANPPVWLVEFADAGHWSFSDVCGLVDAFDPGCGEGTRQTEPGTPFTYLDNELARGTAATYAARFFAAHLRAEAAADAALDVADPEGIVTVSVRRE
jgi:dienelactone hydrolase